MLLLPITVTLLLSPFPGQTPPRVLAIGDHRDGLYFFNQSSAKPATSQSVHGAQASIHTLFSSAFVSNASNAKMWHLLDMARAIRFQSGLPLRYWGECILTAAYLINRLPTHVLDYKSPFELLHHKPPNYSQLKIFGCLCFASIHDNDKFSSRAIRSAFLGYPADQKGYKLLNLANHSIFTSHHVIFHEHVFPYHLNTHNVPSSTTFLDWLSSNQSSPFVNPMTNLMLPHTSYSQINESIDSLLTSPQSVQCHIPASTLISDELITQPVISQTTVSQPIEPHIESDISIPKRSSTRSINRPQWWADYHMPSNKALVNTVKQCVSNFIVSSQVILEPPHYYQVVTQPQWIVAMQKELTALEHNNTWILVFLPLGKKTIGCKWVYKVKYHSNGEIERYKARLVAKGYTQSEGIDYHDTFAPVAKMVTIRTLFVVEAAKGWIVEQLDVNNAFFQGDLHEEVYMSLPLGYIHNSNVSNLVCKLIKSIYGLKQASRYWFEKLTACLLEAGYKQSLTDTSMFTFNQDGIFVVAVVYVDDILLSGNNHEAIVALKQLLHVKFSIKDLGNLKYYLGLEISRTPAGIFVSQKKFIHDLLASANFTDCRPLSVPIDPHLNLFDDIQSGPLIDNPSVYRALVGKLLYLNSSRPDISFSVQILSQYLHAPRVKNMVALTRVLRYLKWTIGHGMFFPVDNSLSLKMYSDSDWAGDANDRKSVGVYCLLLGSIAISWRSKKQAVTSRSSAEAEYRALADASYEILWFLNILTDLGVSFDCPDPLLCDNKAAVDLTANLVYHAGTKHIKLDCHFIREKIKSGLITVLQIPTLHNTADVFTNLARCFTGLMLSWDSCLLPCLQFVGGIRISLFMGTKEYTITNGMLH
ncbi:hypothetical protein AgCh_001442 [Apium graveolens]